MFHALEGLFCAGLDGSIGVFAQVPQSRLGLDVGDQPQREGGFLSDHGLGILALGFPQRAGENQIESTLDFLMPRYDEDHFFVRNRLLDRGRRDVLPLRGNVRLPADRSPPWRQAGV